MLTDILFKTLVMLAYTILMAIIKLSDLSFRAVVMFDDLAYPKENLKFKLVFTPK